MLDSYTHMATVGVKQWGEIFCKIWCVTLVMLRFVNFGFRSFRIDF